MRRWVVRLETEGQVSAGRTRERGFLVPTQRHLPGGAVRGALAAAWMRTHGQPENDPAAFERDIGSLRVGPGLPQAGVQEPLSAMVCKYRQRAECSTVAYDMAFDEQAETCRVCSGPLELSRGGWSGVLVETVARTALGPDERAEAGRLYRREALAPEQVFVAESYGDLSWVPAEGLRLRVGGRRSVGGQARVTVRQEPPPQPEVSGSSLVVRLTSAAVFVGIGGRSSLVPGQGDLSRLVPSGSEPPRFRRSWTRPEPVGGWNAAAGLPTSAEVAAAAGSVFVLDYGRDVTPQDAVRALEEGLGVRRADGFGWLTTRRWQPSAPASPAPARATGDLAVTSIADALARLGRPLTRRVAGWLREGLTRDELLRRTSYSGLVPEARQAVDAALAVSEGEQARLLVVALAARS